MKYKTILGRIMHYVDRKANFGHTVLVANAKRAVNYAYGVGRQSVTGDVSDLKWERDSEHKYIAKNPFFEYDVIFYGGFWSVRLLGIFPINGDFFLRCAKHSNPLTKITRND